MHATLAKFGYPASVLKEYRHWTVLLRPQQITLGSCVICIKDDIQAIGAVGAEAFAEYGQIVAELEHALKAAFHYDKINYLSLMMVDAQAHYHALPRYAAPREYAGHAFIDTSWPKPPTLSDVQELSPAQLNKIQQAIIDHWPD